MSEKESRAEAPEDLDEEDVSAWAGSEPTRAFAKGTFFGAAKRLKELVAAASRSSDPAVAAAHATYVEAKVPLIVLQNRKAIDPSKCKVELP